jgi:hypothetical protein
MLHDYDDQLKLHHRTPSPSVDALAARQHHPLIELEATTLLYDLVTALSKSTGASTITMQAGGHYT